MHFYKIPANILQTAHFDNLSGVKNNKCTNHYLCDMKKILSFVLSLPVHLYRNTISPWLPRVCRHEPSCSQYMLDALSVHGPGTGFLMGINRILRCRPGGTHGYDPVPRFRFRQFTRFRRFPSCNRLKH